MALTARQARAIRSQGCFVCGGWKDEMITIADHRTVICRPCVTRIGRVILAMAPPVVARLWPESDSVREAPRVARRAGRPPADINVDEVFAKFKAAVEKQIGSDAHQAHLDLAHAYGEMGLMADAVREAATALGEGAPLTLASQALNWLFSPERAHPDALPTIARMLKGE